MWPICIIEYPVPNQKQVSLWMPVGQQYVLTFEEIDRKSNLLGISPHIFWIPPAQLFKPAPIQPNVLLLYHHPFPLSMIYIFMDPSLRHFDNVSVPLFPQYIFTWNIFQELDKNNRIKYKKWDEKLNGTHKPSFIVLIFIIVYFMRRLTLLLCSP